MSDGEVDTELSAELKRLLLECAQQAELRGVVVGGQIRVTFTIKCNPKGMLDIAHKCDTKRPAKLAVPATAWATQKGDLLFDMPRQEKLPGVDVDAPERRDVADENVTELRRR
jgi:hypothetical protein